MKSVDFLTVAAGACLALSQPCLAADDLPASLTPSPRAEPRINGPSVVGARPHVPFLYTVPVTGERPIEFGVDRLPAGLRLDTSTGQIFGQATLDGKEILKNGYDGTSTFPHVDSVGGLMYDVVLTARNSRGAASKKFRIYIGEEICRTPPLGWNSWNCWAGAVDQDKVLRSARAMVASGLINHGWTYINIDDTWQGPRGGSFGGLQGNEKFPDMKALCDQIHAMGLKAGIYSTPWVTSYAKFPGGSSDDPKGLWSKELADQKLWRFGSHSFAENDVKQWAAWGFDYLKYDWSPIDVPHVEEISKAVRSCGRDIVLSLSNSAPFEHAGDFSRLANCWRTTGDIWDGWETNTGDWQYGVSEIGFNQDRWAPFARPGHWNDPDMLVVGHVGWGPALHLTKLTPDEQYSHISLWCLLSAPLLIGCDMERLDPFTVGLLSNDEVLAVDQDALGQHALRAGTVGAVDVFSKQLEDGSRALGFFNRARQSETVTYNKLGRIGLPGKFKVRDLWRQKDLEVAKGSLKLTIPGHGVVLLKLTRLE
jgi:alpha-galactosidase